MALVKAQKCIEHMARVKNSRSADPLVVKHWRRNRLRKLLVLSLSLQGFDQLRIILSPDGFLIYLTEHGQILSSYQAIRGIQALKSVVRHKNLQINVFSAGTH